MKVVQPYAHIVTRSPEIVFDHNDNLVMENELSIIENFGRVSHRSEDAQTFDSWKRFIETVVMGHGDWSITEHISLSVEFLVDRGITHEIVRHRLASYTQESTRFVNYEKKMGASFIYPYPDVVCSACAQGREAFINISDDNTPYSHGFEGEDRPYQVCAYDQRWLTAIGRCEVAYRDLIGQGWRPQEARSVFPNALASKLIMTANLRSWRHFFIMRTTKEAHPQMRQVTDPLLEEFKARIPLLYSDIIAGNRQIDNMRLPQ